MNSVQHLAQLLQQSHDGPASALVAYLEVGCSQQPCLVVIASASTDCLTVNIFGFCVTSQLFRSCFRLVAKSKRGICCW